MTCSTNEQILCQNASTYTNRLGAKKVDSTYNTLDYWIHVLRLTEYTIKTARISIFQVSNAKGKVANSLIGVVVDHLDKTACIYHTRKLREDDIIHELLHIKFPLYSEADVNLYVRKFMKRRLFSNRYQFAEDIHDSRSTTIIVTNP